MLPHALCATCPIKAGNKEHAVRDDTPTKGGSGGGWGEHNKFSTNLYTTVDVIPCSRKTSGQVWGVFREVLPGSPPLPGSIFLGAPIVTPGPVRRDF